MCGMFLKLDDIMSLLHLGERVVANTNVSLLPGVLSQREIARLHMTADKGFRFCFVIFTNSCKITIARRHYDFLPWYPIQMCTHIFLKSLWIVLETASYLSRHPSKHAVRHWFGSFCASNSSKTSVWNKWGAKRGKPTYYDGGYDVSLDCKKSAGSVINRESWYGCPNARRLFYCNVVAIATTLSVECSGASEMTSQWQSCYVIVIAQLVGSDHRRGVSPGVECSKHSPLKYHVSKHSPVQNITRTSYFYTIFKTLLSWWKSIVDILVFLPKPAESAFGQSTNDQDFVKQNSCLNLARSVLNKGVHIIIFHDGCFEVATSVCVVWCTLLLGAILGQVDAIVTRTVLFDEQGWQTIFWLRHLLL